jgi:hypothetical protein
MSELGPLNDSLHFRPAQLLGILHPDMVMPRILLSLTTLHRPRLDTKIKPLRLSSMQLLSNSNSRMAPSRPMVRQPSQDTVNRPRALTPHRVAMDNSLVMPPPLHPLAMAEVCDTSDGNIANWLPCLLNFDEIQPGQPRVKLTAS